MLTRAKTYKNDEGIRREQTKSLDRIRLERNWGILAGLLGWLVAFAALVALWMLLPLKRADAVLVTLDTSTGHVVNQQVITPKLIGETEALLQKELHDYVIQRYTVDPEDRLNLESYVHLHSTPDVVKQYDFEMNPDNPNNPYYLVGKNGKTTVNVISVSVTDKHHGTVWYSTTTTKEGGKASKPQYFVFTAAFVYTGKPIAVRDRWVNPLGWAVTSSRTDDDTSHQ